MEWVKALGVSVLAIFAPIQAVILTTGVLVFLDLLTGMKAAKVRGEKINSAGLRRTTTKTLVYLMAICVAYLVEKYMLDGFLPMSKIVSGLIAVTEMRSIYENLDTINGSSLFKKVLEKLGSINDAFKKPDAPPSPPAPLDDPNK